MGIFYQTSANFGSLTIGLLGLQPSLSTLKLSICKLVPYNHVQYSESLMEHFALLTAAFLFGGMLLFSVGFGAMVFKHLSPDQARPFIRQTFPYFYIFVLATSLVSTLTHLLVDYRAAISMLFIFATTIPTRQILMPAINTAIDNHQKKRFQYLHTLSVIITLSHIMIAGAALCFLK